MCGIAGAVAPDGTALASVEGLLGAIVHRGPDDEGIGGDGAAAVGIRRLSIVDLVTGHQPFTAADGAIVAVGNGEIYNHRELRASLGDRHRLVSGSDIEVVPHLYERHGDDFARHLRGMFALAVLDRARGRLVLVRDRLGIKPLYWAERDGRLAFSSEYRALLDLPWVDRTPDVEGLREFAAHAWIAPPRTAVAGIRKLGAGELLVHDETGTVVRRWWERPVPGEGSPIARDELLALLDEVVESHLMSDVPLGVFLSGGLDSSVVAALAARHVDDLQAFTVVFDGDANTEDRTAAAAVASALGLRHHELPVRVAPTALLRDVARHHDEPVGDMACLPTWAMAEAARAHATVVLTGEGGDEAFAGYAKYERLASLLRVGAAPRPARELVASGLELVPRARRVAKALRLADDPVMAGLRFDEVFTASERRALFVDGIGTVDEARPPGGLSPVDAAQWHDAGGPLSELLTMKLDKMTMAHSLEARVPFLDHVLFERAVGLPADQRIGKAVLRTAAEQLLPASVLQRPKRGFTVPMASWLRAELRPTVLSLLDRDRIEAQGVLSPAAVDAIVGDHLGGRVDRNRQVWNLLAMQLWYDEVLG